MGNVLHAFHSFLNIHKAAATIRAIVLENDTGKQNRTSKQFHGVKSQHKMPFPTQIINFY
ncbi:hypothetical protein Hanom_Chr06g00513081 [Helianthus anomalus]